MTKLSQHTFLHHHPTVLFAWNEWDKFHFGITSRFKCCDILTNLGSGIIKCSLMKGTQNRDMAYLRVNGDLNKWVALWTIEGPGAALWLSAQKGTMETAQNQVNLYCMYSCVENKDIFKTVTFQDTSQSNQVRSLNQATYTVNFLVTSAALKQWKVENIRGI